MEVKLVPLPVPTEVRQTRAPGLRQDGLKPTISHNTSDLPLDVLDALAVAWRKDFFEAAGKRDPRRSCCERDTLSQEDIEHAFNKL